MIAENTNDTVTTEKLLYLPNNNRTYIQNTYVADIELTLKVGN